MPPFWMVPSSTVLLKAAVFELCSRQPGGEPVRERVEGRRAELDRVKERVCVGAGGWGNCRRENKKPASKDKL